MDAYTTLLGYKLDFGVQAEILLAKLGYATTAGNPNAQLTPDHIGQECLDTTNNVFYKAVGTTNTSWQRHGSDAILSAQAPAGGVGNTATTFLQTLFTASIPANTLAKNGQALYVKAWGSFGQTAANNKSVNLVVGGKTFASGSQLASGSTWILECDVIKTAPNVQQHLLNGRMGLTLLNPTPTQDTSVDGGAITVSVTGQSGSGAQSDVIANGLIISTYS